MPGSPAHTQVTQLLVAAGAGDSRAAAELLPLVYGELRKLARARMAGEPDGGLGQTIQPTALVHEAYLRLIGDAELKWNNRGHFFGAAALAMRRILVDRARERKSLKRGGDRARVELSETGAEQEPEPEQVLGLDAALTRLATISRRRADVVMLRYFAGLSVDETAMALGVSAATVKNEWKFARAWLRRDLAGVDAVEGREGEAPA